MADTYVSRAEFRTLAPYAGNGATVDLTGSIDASNNIYSTVPDAVIDAYLSGSAATFDSAFRGVGSLPLTRVSDDVRDFVLVTTAYKVLRWVGYADPDQMTQLEKDYNMMAGGSDSWITRVSKGYVRFDPTSDATPTVDEGAPVVSIASGRRDPRSPRKYRNGREYI